EAPAFYAAAQALCEGRLDRGTAALLTHPDAVIVARRKTPRILQASLATLVVLDLGQSAAPVSAGMHPEETAERSALLDADAHPSKSVLVPGDRGPSPRHNRTPRSV